MKKLLSLALAMLVVLAGVALAADLEKVDKKVKALDKRLRQVEMNQNQDRLDITGDFRFEVHNIDADIPAYIDGMQFQQNFVNTMFYMNPAFGNAMPTGIGDIDAFVNDPANYAMYQQFLSGLTFADLQTAYAQFSQDPAMFQSIMGLLSADPRLMQDGWNYKNDVLYTNRLRLNLKAQVAENVNFDGRLTMYKPWGDSSGVQVFNGLSTSMNFDGTSGRTPNSDVLRVERAFFNWTHIADTSVYLSVGRRPSAGGPPMHLRDDEPRAGTPLGTLFDFQFDGITLGFDFIADSKFRLCYGLGYETGFGNAENTNPGNLMKDAHFFGINWDVLNKDGNFVQTTVARAFDVTDGFISNVVMPVNPVTGQAVPGSVPIRYAPSANLGDIDLAGILVMREQGPLDLFASFNYMKSHPEAGVSTPFGGLFSDPFDVAEEQDGTMFYAGARYTLPSGLTRFGAEYNKGSEYWFNFSHGADDIIAPKTGTRGSVVELYATHRFARKLIGKLSYMNYSYDYSGSGWHLGAPKDLDQLQLMGFPTYKEIRQVTFSLMARF